MTQADSVLSTPPTNTSANDLLELLRESAVPVVERPAADAATTSQRACLIAALAIVFLLIAGSVASLLIAMHLEVELAARGTSLPRW